MEAADRLLQLYRLEVGPDRLPLRSPSPNPFAWVHRPREGRFAICLHTDGLASADPRMTALLGTLPKDAFDVMRTPGTPRPEISRVAAFELTPDDDQDWASVSLVLEDHEVRTDVRYIRQWDGMAQMWLGNRAHAGLLLQVLAARQLHCVLYVTDDERLLTVPNARFASPVNVVSTRMALPLISTWLRARGEFHLEHIATGVGDFYTGLSLALTPKAIPAWRALANLEHVIRGGVELSTLGQSIRARLESMLRVLDRMFVIWQLPTNNDSIDEMADCFDSIVLTVAASQDNLALLAGQYLGVAGLQQVDWGLLNAKWRKRLAAVADTRAGALRSFLDAHGSHLRLCAQLRHHAIHRARLAPIFYSETGQREQGRLHIWEPLVSDLVECLGSMGQHSEAWGISHHSEPERIPVTQNHEDGAKQYVLDSPGEALLDPMVFAVRLVDQTARIVNDVIAILDFPSDHLLSAEERVRCIGAPTAFPFRDEDGALLRMLSPLAGLADSDAAMLHLDPSR